MRGSGGARKYGDNGKKDHRFRMRNNATLATEKQKMVRHIPINVRNGTRILVTSPSVRIDCLLKVAISIWDSICWS